MFIRRVNPVTGDITLKKNVPEMSFSINVRVRDGTTSGKFTTTTVRITVIYVTEDAVFNSGSVRINGMTFYDLKYFV